MLLNLQGGLPVDEQKTHLFQQQWVWQEKDILRAQGLLPVVAYLYSAACHVGKLMG